MSKCNNCEEEFDPGQAGLVVRQRGAEIAAVCGACSDGVKVGRITLRRGDVGAFAYDQWSPIEMATGGLSSRRAG